MRNMMWQTPLWALCLAGCEYLAVQEFHDDVLVSFYVMLCVTCFCAFVFGWPKPEWLGSQQIAGSANAWGKQGVGMPLAPTDPVEKLRNVMSVRSYFFAESAHEYTESICEHVNDHLTEKCLMYCGALGLFIFLHKPESEPPGISEILAAMSVSIIPLIWDFSRCRRQIGINKKQRLP